MASERVLDCDGKPHDFQPWTCDCGDADAWVCSRCSLDERHHTIARQAATIERLRAALLTATDVYEGLNEHPLDYDGPCYCDMCKSYGAEHLDGGD